MSITDELREWANTKCFEWRANEILAIADRINIAHKHAIGCVDYRDPETMAENGWMKLPVNADGEYIHIGDKVTCGASVWEVTGFRLNGGFWGIYCTIFNDQGGSGTNLYPPSDLHHYHAPTVEDVLHEFIDEWLVANSTKEEEAAIAECAKKLQLKEEA